MELTIVAVVGLVCVVATSAVSERLGVAAPLGLVVVGLGLGYLPGVDVEVSPHVVLAGVLPPLLYATATRMPAHDFRRDFSTIVSLAVLLVVATTVVSGYVFAALTPAIGLAAAFALGAIVSPTDAVAATSVGKRLGLPSRLLTILEGEGLVNDASALVLLSSATAAMHGDVHLWNVGGEFVYSVLVAVPVGMVIGLVSVWTRSWFREPVFTTSISFVVPFVAYLPAEALHASGVLSVVVAGLVAGHQGPRFLPANTRLAESLNWQTIAFLLEGGIFLVMGLQLESLWRDDSDAGLSGSAALGIGLLATGLVIVLRMLFLVPIVASLRRGAERAEQMRPRLDEAEAMASDPARVASISPRRLARFHLRVTQKRNDIEFAVSERFGWRGGTVLAWSGMRGAVTVAAAQTLPSDTPNRPQLVLIAFTVAVATLLVQGLSLPTVIRALRVPGDDAAADRAALADLNGELATAAQLALDAPDLATADGTPYDDEVLQRVREGMRVRSTRRATLSSHDATQRQHYIELMATVVRAQRDALLQARTEGSFNSRVIRQAGRSLDLQEAMMMQLPSTE